MRALLPHPVSEVDVHEHYATGWLDAGGLRINMVSSLDGAATANGLSKGLQTPGDNAVFAVLRDLADVVLVGASTAIAEKYRPVHLSDAQRQLRAGFGLAPQLPLALVSRSLRLDPGSALFGDAAARSIVFTCADADPDLRAALSEVADVVVCGQTDVDLARVRSELVTRGLTRILSEGGPTLLASLVADGVADELCLSISPMLSGPGPIRIVHGTPWPAARDGLTLTGLLEEDGALFVRMAL